MIRIVLWTFLIAAGTVYFANPIRAQVAVATGFEQNRKVDLLRSNQPGFETAIDTDYSGVRSLDGYEAVKPFIAVLYNRSEHGIKAYVVRWAIIEQTGRKYERIRTPWARNGGREVLTGEQIVWKPGEPRLVSPSFDWGVSAVDLQKRSKLLSALAKGPLATDAAKALRIDIFVDAVVYDDGVLSGPDSGRLFDRYECERNGEQEEGGLVLSLLDLNFSDDEVITRLNADIEKGLAEGGTDRVSLLEAARGREARILLAELSKNGRASLKNLLRRLASHERTILTRQ